jgi:hypothetical protein
MWARRSRPAGLLTVLERAVSGELGAASLVVVERGSVDHERVAEQIDVLAGVADAVGASDPEVSSRFRWAKHELGFHVAAMRNHRDAIHAVEIAVEEAEAVLGVLLPDDLHVDPDTGEVIKIKLVTDNGTAFKSSRFASFVAATGVLEHIRTRRKSPGQNGVRERALGSLNCEHLYRHEITDSQSGALEAERYRQIFSRIRPRSDRQGTSNRPLPRPVYNPTEPETLPAS